MSNKETPWRISTLIILLLCRLRVFSWRAGFCSSSSSGGAVSIQILDLIWGLVLILFAFLPATRLHLP